MSDGPTAAAAMPDNPGSDPKRDEGDSIPATSIRLLCVARLCHASPHIKQTGMY